MARVPGKPDTNLQSGLSQTWQVLARDPNATGDTAAWGVSSVADLIQQVIAALPVTTPTTPPVLGSLHAPNYTNLLASSTDLTQSPPWYAGAGDIAWITGAQRIVVPPGFAGQVAYFQSVPVTASKTYVVEMNYFKAPGSGGGLPRVTFYKLGDTNSTYAAATLTQSGNRYHTSSVYTATSTADVATGGVRVYIEMPAGADNGCDITISNFNFGEAVAPSYIAEDLAYIPPVVVVGGGGSQPSLTPDQLFAQVNTTFNWPTDLPPSDQSAVPAFGTLTNNAKGQKLNTIALDYRTTAGNCGTRELIDAMHFQHHITGNHEGNSAQSGPTMDPTSGASYGLIGIFPKGHTYDNIVPTADGVKLKVINKPADGNVYKNGAPRCGYLRFEQNILPGSYTEVIFKGPRNKYAWTPIWLYNGRQVSFKRINKVLGLNLTSTYGNPLIDGANRYLLDYGTGYKEIDNLDMFFQPPGPGRVLTSGLVWKNGNDGLPQTQVSPYRSFVAADNGFTTSPSGLACLPAASEWYQGFNTLGLYMADDGSNLIQYIWNGRVFQEEYYEFYGPDLVDPLPPHNTEPTGFNLIIGGQFAAGFQEGPNAGVTLDAAGRPGIDLTGVDPDDLSIVVQKVRHWRAGYVPVSRGANFIPQVFKALTLATQPTTTGAFTTTIQGRTAGSTIVAKSSNSADTGISVSGNTVSITVADTAARTITLVEHPTSTPGAFTYGQSRTTSYPLQVGAANPLQDLTLNTNESPAGLPFVARVLGKQASSTITATITPTSGGETALSVLGDTIYSTAAISTLGAATIKIIETLNGSAGSPKTTSGLTVTFKANKITSQNFQINGVSGGPAATGGATISSANQAGPWGATSGIGAAVLANFGSAGGGIQVPVADNANATLTAWVKTADTNNQMFSQYNGFTSIDYIFDSASIQNHFPKGQWVKISGAQAFNAFRLYQQASSTPNFYLWGAAVTA